VLPASQIAQSIIDILMDRINLEPAEGNVSYIINPYAIAQFITAGITLVLVYKVWQKRRAGLCAYLFGQRMILATQQ
jgi:hypothetical protein